MIETAINSFINLRSIVYLFMFSELVLYPSIKFCNFFTCMLKLSFSTYIDNHLFNLYR